jgi:hypothetical protein
MNYIWARFASGERPMGRGSLRPAGRRSRLALIAWGLASLLFFFTVENIWIDTRLRHRFHNLPSLVPEALSGSWFLVLMVGGVALALLVMCQILLIKDRSVSVWMKAGTGIAVVSVLLLGGQWVRKTSGWPSLASLRLPSRTHRVVLKWRASSSQVAGYNVYRSTAPAGNYVRINSSPVLGTTFTDNTVESGLTYYYVTRAVDALGRESVNSNEASAAIP